MSSLPPDSERHTTEVGERSSPSPLSPFVEGSEQVHSTADNASLTADIHNEESETRQASDWVGSSHRAQLTRLSRLSFKRKQKLLPSIGLTKFPPSPLSSNSRHNSPFPRPLATRTRGLRGPAPTGTTSDVNLSNSRLPIPDASLLNDLKSGAPSDWYVEGPGRRVGYDDLTAIDWIFEYTKERQRLRALYSRAKGVVGQLQRLADASQIWIVLIATGLAAGVLAAGIDVASDWLGDLKTGYCKNGPGGGKFYLNKGFCCWGHEG